MHVVWSPLRILWCGTHRHSQFHWCCFPTSLYNPLHNLCRQKEKGNQALCNFFFSNLVLVFSKKTSHVYLFFFLIQLKMGALLIGVLGLFALIVYVSSVFFDHPIRMTLVGYLSVASLISMFASPLLVIVSLYLSLQIS
jgi:hypothetical protein